MYRLFAVKKTQLELVTDRGYIIPPTEMSYSHMTLQDFEAFVAALQSKKKNIRDSLSYIYDNADMTERLLVYYASKENKNRVSTETIGNFIALVEGEQNKSGKPTSSILIIDASLSPQANDALVNSQIKVQIYDESDLTYNVTHHVDVPKHVLLSDEEMAEKLKELRLPASKVGIILSTDPVVRYYGWPPGGMVKIHRSDGTLAYRIITEVKE